jgi:hypothetical protein
MGAMTATWEEGLLTVLIIVFAAVVVLATL